MALIITVSISLVYSHCRFRSIYISNQTLLIISVFLIKYYLFSAATHVTVLVEYKENLSIREEGGEEAEESLKKRMP